MGTTITSSNSWHLGTLVWGKPVSYTNTQTGSSIPNSSLQWALISEKKEWWVDWQLMPTADKVLDQPKMYIPDMFFTNTHSLLFSGCRQQVSSSGLVSAVSTNPVRAVLVCLPLKQPSPELFTGSFIYLLLACCSVSVQLLVCCSVNVLLC